MIFLKQISIESKEKLTDKYWLYNEYVIKTRSINDLSRELLVPIAIVRKYLVEFGFEIRKTTKGVKCREETVIAMVKGHEKLHPERLYYDKEWLEDQYVVQNKSMNQICREFGYKVDLGKWLRKFNIPIRSFSESCSGIHSGGFGKHPSEETLQKLRSRKPSMLGKHFSEETKIKMSESAKGRIITEETRQKISIANKGKRTGKDNPFYGHHHTEETRKMFSENSSKFRHSEETKLVMSQKAKEYRKTNPITQTGMYSKGTWFERLDGTQIWLRSTYETRVATKLDSLCIGWVYEPTTFVIDDTGTTYRPDFYLPELDIWWEVKGWLAPHSKEKLEKFFELYKDKKLLILWEQDIKNFELLPKNSDLYDVINIGKETIDCDSKGNYF